MRLPLVLAALAAIPLLAPAAADAAHLVDVVNNAYRDSADGNAVTRVPAGTTVTWVWRAGVHTVTEGLHAAVPLAGFESGRVSVEDEDPTFSVTFDAPGQHAYYCELHPTMRGLVVVE